jgi:hypothetical protein
MKDVLRIFGGFCLVIALLFGASYGMYAGYQFFKPKYVAVDNQVFQASQQYNEGMVRDLQNLQLEYINGDQSKKDAIRAIVLQRFSVYPQEKMPADLRNFYNSLK